MATKHDTTALKMVVLQRLTNGESSSPLVTDIFPLIREYSFFDRTSMVFARKVAEKYSDIHRMIYTAHSRRNGFHQQEGDDTEHPHWLFCCPEHRVVLQAVSCPVCGGYIISNSNPIPDCVTCRCQEQIQFW